MLDNSVLAAARALLRRSREPTLAERVAASRERVAGYVQTREAMRQYGAGQLNYAAALARFKELGHDRSQSLALMREGRHQSNVQRLAQFNKLAVEARQRGLDFPESTTVLSQWRSENRLKRVKAALGLPVPAHEAAPPTRREARAVTPTPTPPVPSRVTVLPATPTVTVLPPTPTPAVPMPPAVCAACASRAESAGLPRKGFHRRSRPPANTRPGQAAIPANMERADQGAAGQVQGRISMAVPQI